MDVKEFMARTAYGLNRAADALEKMTDLLTEAVELAKPPKEPTTPVVLSAEPATPQISIWDVKNVLLHKLRDAVEGGALAETIAEEAMKLFDLAKDWNEKLQELDDEQRRERESE